MTIRKLERQEWRSFFDAMSKLLEAKDAAVEMAALDLGDQTEAECCRCWASVMILAMMSLT